MGRSSVVCAVALVAFVVGVGPAVADGAGPTAWIRPVDGAVVAPFVAPSSPYGPGHRGADFAAASGTPVRAAGAGVVSFAGEVAGSLHVVVAHDGGLRTSYSFLARVDVRAGQRVARGQLVAAAGGAGPPDEAGRLHFGLRVGDRYVDPMQLFRPVDLTEVVRLAPVGEPAPTTSVAGERRELAASLRIGGEVPAWMLGSEPRATHDDGGGVGAAMGDLVGGAAQSAGSALGTAWQATAALARGGVTLLEQFPKLAVVAWRHVPEAPLLGALVETSQRAVAWARSRERCTADAPPPDGTGGSGHLVMGVAGIDSATGSGERALDLPFEQLGYRADEVFSFSYAAHGSSYTDADTWGELRESARRLGAQLREVARAHPGREVDLLAHSQGGLVVRVFLQEVYDPGDPANPPLGTVVTLSSPLEGAPAATAAAEIARSRSGRDVLGWLADLPGLPSWDAPSVRELDESSSFLRDVRTGALPDQVDLTSVGAVDDVVVPATNIDVPGATTVVVNPRGADDHSGIVTSPRALRAVRLALEGRPPPCVSAWTGLRAAVEPVVVTRLEHGIGKLGAAAGALTDMVRRVGG